VRQFQADDATQSGRTRAPPGSRIGRELVDPFDQKQLHSTRRVELVLGGVCDEARQRAVERGLVVH
jgi:hypothetical protein